MTRRKHFISVVNRHQIGSLMETNQRTTPTPTLFALYSHPICGCAFVLLVRFVGWTVKTALSRSGRVRTRACKASRWSAGTDTSIMSEKYDGPKRPATLSPTLPPTSITAPVTSDTIPRRSTPAALMIKLTEWWDELENRAV